MRLIDADKSDEIIVFDKQNELLQCSAVRDYCKRQREFLNKFPTVDAEPVRHGHWVDAYPDIEPKPMFMYGICSVCGFEQSISNKLKYCPNCGSNMTRRVNENKNL